MSLREKIEAAKQKGTRLRTDLEYAAEVYDTEEDRAARSLAKLKADTVLANLPNLASERAEMGLTGPTRVADIGSISTLDDLRTAFRHYGCYVLRALESEGYTLFVSIDCSGNWTTDNALMADI